MNRSIDLGKIYDDAYGRAVDIDGRHYLDTNGQPLSVAQLAKVQGCSIVGDVSQHSISDNLTTAPHSINNSISMES